jgi:hypothetical protein
MAVILFKKSKFVNPLKKSNIFCLSFPKAIQTPESEQTDCKKLDRILSPVFFTPVFFIKLPMVFLARFSVIRRTADRKLALLRELLRFTIGSADFALGGFTIGSVDFVLGGRGGFIIGSVDFTLGALGGFKLGSIDFVLRSTSGFKLTTSITI